jgi:hypothetical protein
MANNPRPFKELTDTELIVAGSQMLREIRDYANALQTAKDEFATLEKELALRRNPPLSKKTLSPN